MEQIDSLRWVLAGAIASLTLCSMLTWTGAGRYALPVHVSRPIMGVGAIGVVIDSTGLGAVLGAALFGLGLVIAWEAMPAPEVPRPRTRLTFLVIVFTTLACAVLLLGVGPASDMAETTRNVGALAGLAVGGLLAVAAADRARVRLRERVADRLGVPDDTTAPSVLS